LFSSVYITHPQTPDENQTLPMKVELVEAKHKSISVAASFQMTYGPGIAFAWENRNVGGMGRKLSLSLDIAQHTHSGTAALNLPDFIDSGQDLLIQADASNEEITAYHDRSYTMLIEVSRALSDSFNATIGVKPETLIVKESVHNGTFFLMQLPFSFKYSTTDNTLHATTGHSFEYQATAAINFKESSLPYFSQSFTYCSYLTLLKKDFLVMAQKIALHSIFSPDLEAVPVPKRLFGGSEDQLRGYRYFTVSPLQEGTPLGGRSAIYYSFEPRFRLSETIGIVPFFDFGNVFTIALPDFKGKWFKSVGMGFRYFSFLGPFRLDLAFPMDRRKEIDPAWWVFASIGQSF
ncbi:MAG TPA: BamA/TamA family outer membrane protein, partial [Rhabdochlamydiaceae bacterium]|nr:BamA/TamA family outer membrane protein [Rhabdochlamydiaceae bacterium]